LDFLLYQPRSYESLAQATPSKTNKSIVTAWSGVVNPSAQGIAPEGQIPECTPFFPFYFVVLSSYINHKQMSIKNLLTSLREINISEDHLLEKKRVEPEMLEAPEEERYIEEYSTDTIFHWNAPEFEIGHRDNKRLAYATLVLLAIIGYATYSNNPVMAITFVLIGIVAYMHIHREPRNMDFRLVPEGVLVGDRELYHFDDTRSFWIFYDPGYKKVISLHTTSYLTPFVHIPIHNEDPVEIRKILLKHLPEVKQEYRMVDALERFLGI
jgi:hypothetical protein